VCAYSIQILMIHVIMLILHYSTDLIATFNSIGLEYIEHYFLLDLLTQYTYRDFKTKRRNVSMDLTTIANPATMNLLHNPLGLSVLTFRG
jgi:hypothetical protein